MSKNFLDIKEFFPIFQYPIDGNKFIYLDSAATTQTPIQVTDAMLEYYHHYKANIGRGIYTYAEQATQRYELVRKMVASMLHVKPHSIIFTAGATDSINLVARSWGQNHIQSGDEIIVSNAEHHSNFVVWQQLAMQKNAKLIIVPVNQDGVVTAEILKQYMTNHTKLIALFHVSNVTGGMNDVAALATVAHEYNVKILIDGAQAVAHHAINLQALNPDFYLFSGHKIFGPTGVGVLYVNEQNIDQMRSVQFGGGMVFSVQPMATEFKKFPYNFEAGSANIAGVIGLGAAIDFVNNYIDMTQLSKHETMLAVYCIEKLKNIDHIVVVSAHKAASLNLVTFYSKKIHAHDIAAYCSAYGIAVRAGHHCVQVWHEHNKINASVRVSFSVYNSKQEIDFLIEKIAQL